MSYKRRCCGPFDTSGHSLVAMGAPGSSGLFATRPAAGATGAFTHQPTLFDEAHHSTVRPGFDPEALLLHTDDVKLIERAMSHLPDRFCEVLVLRELEGLSYREVAGVMGIPMGTVMSSLSRARQAFRGAVNNQLRQSGMPTNAHPREPEADAVLA